MAPFAQLIQLLILASELFIGKTTGTQAIRYHLRLRGARGTKLIRSFQAPEILCALFCFRDPSCKAFNILESSQTCEILHSWGFFPDDPASNMYTIRAFSNFGNDVNCTECLESVPPSATLPWNVECNRRRSSFVRGLSSNSSDFSRIDRLLCRLSTTLVFSETLYHVLNNSGDCISSMGQAAAVVAIWSNDGAFYNPTEFSVLCQAIISGQKVDTNACMYPEVTYENTTYFGYPFYIHTLLCPLEMVIISIHQKEDMPYRIKCCSVIGEIYVD